MPLSSVPNFYTRYYCEENVWRLLQDSALQGEAPHALFISNPRRGFAMWRQRIADSPDEPVLWDYHVVALAHRERWEIWDLDTQLGFPFDALGYLRASFPLNDHLPPETRPRFRLVPRADLIARFASDRSHMRTPEGELREPPPDFPPIRTEAETMNLWSWVDTEVPFVGEVFDLAALLAKLASGFS